MAKKDFSGLGADRVLDVLSTAAREPHRNGQQAPAGPEEIAQRVSEMRTQGRLGAKLPRITLAFSGENYDYVRTMARVRGQNMTQFVNDIIKAHREEYAELYDQARRFLEDF